MTFVFGGGSVSLSWFPWRTWKHCWTEGHLDYLDEPTDPTTQRTPPEYSSRCLAWLCFSVRCHHCYTLHRRNTQPDQLRLLHQLPVIRRDDRRSAVLPLEETQPVPTHPGTNTSSTCGESNSVHLQAMHLSTHLRYFESFLCIPLSSTFY